MKDEFDDKVDRLIKTLREIVIILKSHGEPHSHWVDWITRDLVAIRQGNARGLSHFLSAFGGAGSLNEVAYDDHRLGASLDLAHALARDLKRELDASPK